ncbi:MAG TPA: hypothetical protein VFL90_05435, partial [Methylomirabilota bacterium]|nr:hypothetical protein [Methylomirabilota bacterium]
LPLALVPPARLLESRWAAVTIVAIALAISIAGEEIAQAGFAVLQPVSVIGEAIAKDPGSTIAQAAAIRARSRGAITPLWLRLVLPLGAAAAMSAVDPRRRPALAGAAYGVALVALYGWSTSRSPAFAPLVPSATENALAIVLAAMAGLLGGAAGRHLARALAPDAQAASATVTRRMTSVVAP